MLADPVGMVKCVNAVDTIRARVERISLFIDKLAGKGIILVIRVMKQRSSKQQLEVAGVFALQNKEELPLRLIGLDTKRHSLIWHESYLSDPMQRSASRVFAAGILSLGR
jgi:hypothetical protein